MPAQAGMNIWPSPKGFQNEAKSFEPELLTSSCTQSRKFWSIDVLAMIAAAPTHIKRLQPVRQL